MTFNGTEQQAKIIELLRSGFPVKRNCQKTTLTTFNSSQALGKSKGSVVCAYEYRDITTCGPQCCLAKRN